LGINWRGWHNQVNIFGHGGILTARGFTRHRKKNQETCGSGLASSPLSSCADSEGHHHL
jgi:hypothetical protein